MEFNLWLFIVTAHAKNLFSAQYSSMMKGDWLLVLALRDRAAKESLPVVEEEEYGDLAIWLQQKFDGYFAILVKKNTSELHLLYR